MVMDSLTTKIGSFADSEDMEDLQRRLTPEDSCGSFADSELPGIASFSSTSWGLHFVDHRVESAYSEEGKSKIYQQVAMLHCSVGQT